MSKIRIERQIAGSPEEIKERIAGIEPKLSDKYNVKLNWNDMQANLKGPGVNGEVRINGNNVMLEIKLGLMLRPLAGKIKEGLERSLDKALS
ncbi:MAG: polyhydroxyalkanoic acid system family protein [Myxococcota bacterium]|jgi:putative polyhydroxyalkanoate system protein|nr:polyhydroxyalkanoic acid system family protein [Myxococcota bacterium]